MSESPLVKRVLAVVAVIPPGNVTSYGEVAKVAGCGARNVGTVLKRHGASTAWWRVVRADGTSHDPVRAEDYWDREAIAHAGGRVKMHEHGIDARELQELME
ncbi:MGMT family protein [Corynebacterium aurimucosum]|uniref:MGMT family protein n=1 Tax=Corynebacterium aurimucosum TaxID=169292 RepID=UPI00066B368A|nr:MGMT family protein [Corynebacterium aurimucosum]